MDKKKFIYVSLTIMICLVFFIVFCITNKKSSKWEEISVATPISDIKVQSINQTSNKLINYQSSPKNKMLVDIKGAISKPGVYLLSEDSRLYDLIEKAGGLKEAEEANLPLAIKLEDQMTVIIPSKGDLTNEIIKPQMNNNPVGSNSKESTKININTADRTQLQTLDGVGEKKAESIINHRNEHGPFQKIEDLSQVKGIGVKTIENWKDKITVD